jgi:hypothetical protein
LLGAPLFQGPSLDQAWTERCEDLSRAASRLNSIGAQDALIFLHASFGAPRVQHLLSCSPSVDHTGLSTFDDLQRKALSRMSNSNLNDVQWVQASLPIKDGGLGLRRVASLALPAFLSSAASSAPLQEALLASCPNPGDGVSRPCLIYGSLGSVPLQWDLWPSNNHHGTARGFCQTRTWSGPAFTPLAKRQFI